MNQPTKRNRTFQKAFHLVYSPLKSILTEINLKTPKIVVGVSGGADSLALLIVLKKVINSKKFQNLIDKLHINTPELTVVIVDHGIQNITKDVAKRTKNNIIEKLNLSEQSVNIHTLEIFKKNETNLEEKAREARQEIFSSYNPDILLLAHTINDQAETILLRLSRSSGLNIFNSLNKVAKMPILNSRTPSSTIILRPFIEITRSETEEICEFYNFDYWEDPTNYPDNISNTTFPTRSRLRKFIFPMLEKLFPGIIKNFARTAKFAQIDIDFINQEQAKYKYEEISLENFKNLHQSIRLRILYNHISKVIPLEIQKNISFQMIEEIDQKLIFNNGKNTKTVELPGGYFIEKTNSLIKHQKQMTLQEFLKMPNPMPTKSSD